ncbi:MAG: hypothetical protein ACR2MX_02810 [Cyclobacteriaceae bacterium]
MKYITFNTYKHLNVGTALNLGWENLMAQKAFSKCFLICLLALFTFSCSDDEPTISITTQASTVSFGDLNTCDIGSGDMATLFEFTIPYQASSAIEIEKVITDWKWSNGDQGTNEETNLNNNGASVVYDWCWRFGTLDWVELSARLVTKQGVTSNSSVVRLNKPDGAN